MIKTYSTSKDLPLASLFPYLQALLRPAGRSVLCPSKAPGGLLEPSAPPVQSPPPHPHTHIPTHSSLPAYPHPQPCHTPNPPPAPPFLITPYSFHSPFTPQPPSSTLFTSSLTPSIPPTHHPFSPSAPTPLSAPNPFSAPYINPPPPQIAVHPPSPPGRGRAIPVPALSASLPEGAALWRCRPGHVRWAQAEEARAAGVSEGEGAEGAGAGLREVPLPR